MTNLQATGLEEMVQLFCYPPEIFSDTIKLLSIGGAKHEHCSIYQNLWFRALWKESLQQLLWTLNTALKFAKQHMAPSLKASENDLFNSRTEVIHEKDLTPIRWCAVRIQTGYLPNTSYMHYCCANHNFRIYL